MLPREVSWTSDVMKVRSGWTNASEAHIAEGDREGFRTLRDFVKLGINAHTEAIAQFGGNLIVPSIGVA